MAKLLKPVLISLLVGIVGALMVTASQRNPASEVRADTTGVFHIRLPHLVQDDLPSNKSSEYISEEFSEFLDFITVLPLYNILIGISLASLALFLYKLLCTPLKYIRELGEAGFITDGRDQREVGEEIRKRKNIIAGNIPPVYPNGWFTLSRTVELKNGDVQYVQGLGRHFAVYRGEDGKAYIIDAMCPHDGANIGVGGKVKGDCIKCPTGGCTFRGSDGKCMNTPTDQKVPDNANTRAWDCIERANFVIVWHHAERVEPSWVIEELPDIKAGKVHYHGYSEHYVTAHIEDLPENGADVAHFDHLHGPSLQAGRDLRYKYFWWWNWIRFSWAGKWYQHEEDKHVGVFELDVGHTFFGYSIPLVRIIAKGLQIGPGMVAIHFNNIILGDIYVIFVALPVEPMLQRVYHHFYTTSRLPRPLAKIVGWGEALQFERDMMAWNYKTYKAHPVLTKEEGCLHKHRRWFAQFYSENSPRYTAHKDGVDF